MVFFSTYRNKRLVSSNFMMGPVLRMRAVADYYTQRAWNGALMWMIPGELRFWITGIPIIYFYHRWHNDHSLEVDGVEKAMIMRWGGSVEEVRKLSPQDQVRVRAFVDLEKLYSAYGPKDTVIQPAGSLLPGKDFYHKEGDEHHHH